MSRTRTVPRERSRSADTSSSSVTSREGMRYVLRSISSRSRHSCNQNGPFLAIKLSPLPFRKHSASSAKPLIDTSSPGLQSQRRHSRHGPPIGARYLDGRRVVPAMPKSIVGVRSSSRSERPQTHTHVTAEMTATPTRRRRVAALPPTFSHGVPTCRHSRLTRAPSRTCGVPAAPEGTDRPLSPAGLATIPRR